MVKKKRKTSKKTKRKSPVRHVSVRHESDIRVEKTLIENFVALQKIMVELSSKFEDLSINIKKLLDLFENAAKSLAKDGPDPSSKKEAESIMKKLDNLADQNKLIARGLTLMGEKNLPPAPVTPGIPKLRMAPSIMNTPKAMPSSSQKGVDLGGYQKSISEI